MGGRAHGFVRLAYDNEESVTQNISIIKIILFLAGKAGNNIRGELYADPVPEQHTRPPSPTAGRGLQVRGKPSFVSRKGRDHG